MSNEMNFLCGINPRAGKDGEVIASVKDAFGKKANITLVEEVSDIYVVCDASSDVLEKLKKLQANPNVIDTQIEVIKTHLVVNKKTESDNVFLVLADTEAGKVDSFIEALKNKVDKVGAGDIELLYIGEIFSPRADVAVLFLSKIPSIPEINSKVRTLPGVEDTTVYKLRNI